MLKIIADFTIPDSSSHLFYKNNSGKIVRKSYYKHFSNGFFINGDVVIKDGK